jgi:tol-pal system protein YbgF
MAKFKKKSQGRASISIKVFLFITFVLFCVTSCASQKDMVYLNRQLSTLFRQTKEDRQRFEKAIKELEQAQETIKGEVISEQKTKQSELEERIGTLETKQSELGEILKRYSAEQTAKQRELMDEVKAREAEQEAKDTMQEAQQKKAIETLQKDRDSLRTTVAQIEADFLGVKENIQVLTGKIEESNHLLKAAIEKDTTKNDAIVSQLRELTYITEDMKSRLEILENYMNAEVEAKKERARLEQSSPPQGIQEKVSSVPQKRELTESELYDRTLGYYRDGRYEEAIADFNNFLKLYPKSELADNAHFWIGECYRAQDKYEEAILAYQKVINGYPAGNKVPIAMLHQGFAFEKIDDITTAKLVFKKLVKNFPDSKEAEIARKRL